MSESCNDLLIEQGATFERTLTIKDSEGVAIDITGWTFRGQIRKTYSDTTVIESFNFTIKDQITDKGKVLMYLTDSETEAIPVLPATGLSFTPTRYVYSVEAENDDNFVYRLLQGICIVSPEVTR